MRECCDGYDLSVIIPTFRESANIDELVRRIFNALGEHCITGECIIIDDDSKDGMEEKCKTLKKTYNNLRLIVRKNERGLSTAVIRGINESNGRYLLVMDADLSHPPEKIPELFHIAREGSDFVIGSRYTDGGETEEKWGFYRKLNSKVATLMASPLVDVKDPMAGFFCMPRNVYNRCATLSPIGYKIALEIIVKAGVDKVAEVPIKFSNRKAGKSKMNFKEQLNYIRHLRLLYRYKFKSAMQFLQFIFVGGTGFIVDTVFYFALQFILSVHHLSARAVSFIVAATWNWYWNRNLTFECGRNQPRISQWAYFIAVACLGFFLNWGTYYLLTEKTYFFSKNHYMAFITGVIAGTFINFVLSKYVVFRDHIQESGKL